MDYQEFVAQKARRHVATGTTAGTISSMLFAWQHDIVRWALVKGRAAIFADCGLGKTPMQLEWARIVSEVTGQPVLILAPLAVAQQTVAEGVKFCVEVTPCRSHDDVRDGVNIANYEMLHHFDASVFSGVVLDESSILKSYDGKTRTAIISAFADTPFRLACTATPAPNDHMELGNHAEFLGVMSRTEMLSMFFVHDGGSTQSWRLKGHAVAPFWDWLCSWAVAMRSPSDVGHDDDRMTLPPISYEQHVVDVDFRADGSLFGDVQTLADRRRARRESLDARCGLAADLVNASRDPWIVWCGLNDESATLTTLIPDAVEVTGAMDAEVKTRALNDFASGRARVIVTKPSIAGFGLNWQHCAHQVFVGLSDSYEQYYQAVRRSWRFGQTRPVDVHVVTASSDGPIVANIKRKEQDASEMMTQMVGAMRLTSIKQLEGSRVTQDTYATDVRSGDNWTMYLGDCVEGLREHVEDDSIGLSIFSPPFASLYTYSASAHDMGNVVDGGEFAEHFGYLVDELYRVTMPGRHVAMHCMQLPSSKVRDGHIGLKDFRGDLIRIFEARGFIFHSEVTIWKDPVTAMQRTKALGLLWKQIKKDSSMSRMGIADYVVTMRKPGDNPRPIEHTAEDFPVDLWQKIASPVWMDINATETLQYMSAREHEDERHICPLQLEVIRRCLRLWSAPGDTILDPFMGIGSTAHETLLMGARKVVGFELKRSYWGQAVRNCQAADSANSQTLLFG